MRDGLFPVGGGGGGGGLSSVGLPGVGGRGGLFEKGEELPGVDWRRDPPNPEFLLPGKGGGVIPKLICLLAPGTGGGPLLCKLKRLDWMGLGVFGTGGRPVSGLKPASGLGGGIRLLCGSGAAVLCPEGSPGNLPSPPEGEKGFADVVLPPGGNTGALLAVESGNEKKTGHLGK